MDIENIKNLGDRIRYKRKELGWTQKNLGRVIGCHSSYISYLEVGHVEGGSIRPDVGYTLSLRFESWLAGETFEPADIIEHPRTAALESTPDTTPEAAPEAAPEAVDLDAEHRHHTFGTLQYYVEKRQHVYLWGLPGSGKSTAAEQVAEELGLPYGYVSLNPQTSEFRLLGYKDAMGVYQETVFRHCYEHGGVFCVDELDNANPALLTTLNGMLESDLGAFPDCIVARHPDFVFVATGNTNGRGATKSFPDRRKMDCAMMDRLAFVEWGYDEILETAIACKIAGSVKVGTEVTKWVQAVRAWASEHAPLLAVTPRASFRLCAALRSPQTNDELLDTVLFHGIDKEIVGACLSNNRFNLRRRP